MNVQMLFALLIFTNTYFFKEENIKIINLPYFTALHHVFRRAIMHR